MMNYHPDFTTVREALDAIQEQWEAELCKHNRLLIEKDAKISRLSGQITRLQQCIDKTPVPVDLRDAELVQLRAEVSRLNRVLNALHAERGL